MYVCARTPSTILNKFNTQNSNVLKIKNTPTPFYIHHIKIQHQHFKQSKMNSKMYKTQNIITIYFDLEFTMNQNPTTSTFIRNNALIKKVKIYTIQKHTCTKNKIEMTTRCEMMISRFTSVVNLWSRVFQKW